MTNVEMLIEALPFKPTTLDKAYECFRRAGAIGTDDQLEQVIVRGCQWGLLVRRGNRFSTYGAGVERIRGAVARKPAADSAYADPTRVVPTMVGMATASGQWAEVPYGEVENYVAELRKERGTARLATLKGELADLGIATK
jgi:hypothetical protein